MQKNQKIEWLQDIVKMETINGNEKIVAKYIQNKLKQVNISTELIQYADNRSNLVATIKKGNSDKVLGLTGHMDVVDPGDTSDWKYPPFSAIIEGNKLYGRGSTDMKSGLMAMVIAMIELQEEQKEFNGTIKLLATVGEEVGELGAEQLTNLGYVDDLDGLIVGEPSNYNLVYTHMGSINYTVTSEGKEAHSSMPQEGYNALNHLIDFSYHINQKMDEISSNYVNEELGSTIHNITIMNGGKQVNSIPNFASLQGNIRSIPEFSNDDIIKVLQDTVDELNKNQPYKLNLTIDYNKLSVKANKQSELIEVIQQQFDEPLPLIGIGATTDTAEFIKSSNSFDFVVFGPGESTLPHQVNEYVDMDNYLDMIDKYKQIMLTYLN
ncbi:ArgE/DapE family deacylase [Melissococcus sp. OM08-11BH]|uniref:ArgE/DapE family deacylase n=1 Tax=Melissococcus sp. OM08-11BH TaxID=2293110 RepID=UPI000E4C958E|nr:ArgE/DapE family deacylase [Melissococcus sp. OM08-11BH]RGI28519.1 M20/M25/M40 family metallo-hydrolase [Melissococcus sp. OM08-11BH]